MDARQFKNRDDRSTPGGRDGSGLRVADGKPDGSPDGAAEARARELRERYLIDLNLLAMALPLLVLTSTGMAAADAKAMAGLEAVLSSWGDAVEGTTGMIDAAGAMPVPVSGGRLTGTAEPGDPPLAARLEQGAGDSPANDAFAVGFAADLQAPSTLDHLWNGTDGSFSHGFATGAATASQGWAAGQQAIAGVASGEIAPRAAGGENVADGGTVDHAALLEASFWALASELVDVYPQLLGALSSLIAVDEVDQAHSGLLVETGGDAFATGDVAIADGDIFGTLHHNSTLTIATGYTYFEALSQAIDGRLADAEASSWAQFTGADIILTLHQDTDTLGGASALSTSRIDYYALDYAAWAPDGDAVHITLENEGAEDVMVSQLADWAPQMLAAVTADVSANAPHSFASASTQSVAQSVFYTSVSAQALFGGTV